MTNGDSKKSKIDFISSNLKIIILNFTITTQTNSFQVIQKSSSFFIAIEEQIYFEILSCFVLSPF